MEENKKELLLKILHINSKNMLLVSRVINFLDTIKRRRRNYVAHQRELQRELAMLLSAVSEFLLPVPRIIWEKPRTKLFWEHDCRINDEEFFKQNFRMSRKCFDELCALLPNLERADTNMRNTIPLTKRVAIALYALGSAAEYRTIGNVFGVGKSTVCNILLEFCKEVWVVLQPLYVNDFPLTKERIEENVKGFQKMGFPQCFGAIDGCHIEVRPHGKDAVDYHNYKGWYSTVLLALVDYRYRIMYLNVGTPGRSNDSSIYENSSLKQEISECQLFEEMISTLANVSVPICILGDSAFKLSRNLMKPYPFSTDQSEAEKLFNYTLSKCRRVVENCFGHLKSRFRRIGKGLDNEIDKTNLIIKACCVLHNLLNSKNDSINQTWLLEHESMEKRREYPTGTTILGDTNASAQQIRHAIASFLADGVGGGGQELSSADNNGVAQSGGGESVANSEWVTVAGQENDDEASDAGDISGGDTVIDPLESSDVMP